jgi:dienelactone hydrolase
MLRHAFFTFTMMRILIFLLLFTPAVLNTYGQITNDTYKNWNAIFSYNISPDGRYVFYTWGSPGSNPTLELRSVRGNYQRQFPHSAAAAFSGNGNWAFINQYGLLRLSDHFLLSIPHADKARFSGDWLGYLQQDTLSLRQLSTSLVMQFYHVNNFQFNTDGSAVLIQMDSTLLLFRNGLADTLLHKHADEFTFDHTGQKIAIIAAHTLYLWEHTLHIKYTNEQLANIPPSFSDDDQMIGFQLNPNPPPPIKDSNIITDRLYLWHYKDDLLLSQQQLNSPENTLMVIGINSTVPITLQTMDTLLAGVPGNHYAIIRNSTNDADDFWQRVCTYTLLYYKDGSRQNILTPPHAAILLTLSPEEKFVTWYDSSCQHYFSYEIATHIRRDLSAKISQPLYMPDLNRQDVLPFGIAGWLPNDSALLIYDAYDLWMIDPLAVRPPVNVTSGYGRQHHISLRLATDAAFRPHVLSGDLLLAGLDEQTMNNGFFRLSGLSHLQPLGSMDTCLYYFPGLFVGEPAAPLKAANANVYLLLRQTAASAPDLLVTTDFKSYKALSNIHPERNYNWLHASLHHWHISDSLLGTGILYIPDNFDSTRKYPVIFNYYEKRSTELNKFLRPGLSNGPMSIPWYVCNGYLVFVPDIYRPTGKTGEAILQTVLTAADYLSHFSFVDTAHMGLQGHSFGAYETNYIISHTHRFAAALSACGLTDPVSLYNDISFGGRSMAFYCERGQFNLGATPWERPDIYNNANVMNHADQITTPLLLLHNKGDAASPFYQGLALYLALRRLQRPVWLLQYDGEGHVMSDPSNLLDFTIRQQQFFNYYLKQGPMPDWMAHPSRGLRSGL